LAEKELEEGHFVGHFGCAASELKKAGVKRWGNIEFEDCDSSDGNAIYESDTDTSVTYSGFCWSCNQNFFPEHLAKSSLAEELGMDTSGVVGERKEFVRKEKQPALDKDQVKALISKLGYTDETYRGIRPETFKFFGHLAERDRNGEVKAFYYPETRDESKGWPTGYKIRYLPKYFSKVGQTGIKSHLAGQTKFMKGNHRDILIVEGEVDMCSAYQMLRDNQIAKGQQDYAGVPVVSTTTGAGSAVKQIRDQYDFFDKFTNIYICMDQDEAGIAATQAIAEVLPKEKVKIISCTYGDPNKTLMAGKSKQFMSDYYSARDLVDNGIFASAGLLEHVKEALQMPRIPLPTYMKGLQSKTKGAGVIKNRIYNIIGITSCGKSTHINNIVYNCAFLPEEKTAVVSLEMTKGEYGVDILSLHLETNLYWKQADDVQSYLEDPIVVEKANELFIDEFGESRFFVVDDRKGTVSSLELLCETLRVKHGVTVIIIDVLSDLLRVTSNEDQAKHMNWQANFVKSGVTIFNVMHTRKLENSTNGAAKKATEFDCLGSSIFVQKAAGNFVINRNKMCPDEDWIERNSTYVDCVKMRQGETGEAGVWLYDPETRQTYDRESFFEEHPDKLPVGYDLTISSFDKEYYEEGGRGFKGESSGKSKFKRDTGNDIVKGSKHDF
tara:strand:- start:34 stop:2034 length:2001 start_codon:yes stop_codon:yes gene_type:complete